MKILLLGVFIFIGYLVNQFLGILLSTITVLYILIWNIPLFYSLSGNKKLNENKYDEALKFYEKACKMERASDNIRLTYAILLLRCAKPQDAIEMFNLLILSTKTKAEIKKKAKEYRTLAYYKIGNTEDALDDAQEIFESYKSTISYTLICYLKLCLNKSIDEVYPLCVEAYEYNSDDRDICDNMMLAHIRKGEFEQAVKIGDMLIEKYPTFVEGYFHSAVAQFELNNKDTAVCLIQKLKKNAKRTFLTTVSEEEINEFEKKISE